MTTRIMGVIGSQYDLSAHINTNSKKNNEINIISERSNVWCTSNFDLSYYTDDKISFVADWNIYGDRISTPESFVENYKNVGFEEALKGINGEFSIVLYEKNKNILYMARDRFGYKPLYYTKTSELFGFASHASWLLKLPNVDSSISNRNIALFAGGHYRYIDNDVSNSLFQNIYQVPASHYLIFKDDKIDVKRYWNINTSINYNKSENQIIEEYKDLFINAVSLRNKTYSDKKCFLLSGGLDSSSVLSTSVFLNNKKQDAFSTVYKDKTYDESEDIQTILSDCVDSWNPISIDEPDFFDIIGKMVVSNDAPVATATWLSHYLLYAEISRQGFKNIYGGLGGDELNAGEFEYFFYFFADLKKMGDENRLSQEIKKWAEYHDHPIYKKNFDIAAEGWLSYTNPNNSGELYFDRKKYSRYYEVINKDFYDLNLYDPYLPNLSKSYLNSKTLSDIFYETVPCCFRANDRHDFEFDVRTHFPFFDHTLVEFAHQIPPEYKIKDGVTKNILRQSMKGIMPEETRCRVKKTGWNAPFHIWMFQKNNKENIYDLINSQKFQQRGIYNSIRVKELLQEHELILKENRMTENHMMFFWQLINLELWFQSLEN